MNWLDLVLLVSLLSFAVSGYRQGFVVGALAFAGFLGGGVLGLIIAPTLVGGLDPGVLQSVLAVGIVLVCASVGQVTAAWLGSQVRETITWEPARVVDAGLGALVSVLAMLLVSWFLASALRPGPVPALSRQISDSTVITTVDQLMPDDARTLFSSFRRVLDDSGLPSVFGGLSPERIRPIAPPNSQLARSPAVQRASESVVRVSGSAEACGRRLEGSGFVFARRHVMTNAHVVAGVEDPEVSVGDQTRRYDAKVVLFDPDRDLAVLDVPDLPAAPLAFDDSVDRGDPAIVAGYPGGGSLRLEPARVRDSIQARGPDIYHTKQVTRDVLSLRADVEPGNSGGPLLSPSGDAYGVVFAKSLDDADTGYALEVSEARSVAEAGRSRTREVSTGSCA